MRILITLLTAFGLAMPASAETTGQSIITIQVQTSLAGLNDWLEQTLPAKLHQREQRGQVCIPAERACTKIPEFRGFKIYSRMECIDITPRIKCDISEEAVREGPFKLSGSGGTLTARQVIGASVRARGTGEIGKNITQTARGALALTLHTTPAITPDWTIKSNADIGYSWTRRPEVKLFNLIPVTIAGEVEGALSKKIAALKNGGADAALAELNLRARMQSIWEQARQPVEIKINENTKPIFLHLQPHSVAASNLSFSGNMASISLQLAGRAKATPSRTPPWTTQSELPNIGNLPADVEGFALNLPIQLDWDTVNNAFAQSLPLEVPVNVPSRGRLTISAARFSWSKGTLLIHLDVSFVPSSALLPRLSGSATVRAEPDFDAETRVLSLQNLALQDSSPVALTALVSLAQTLNRLETKIALPLANNIEALEEKLRVALISSVIKNAPDLKRNGDLAIGFDDLKIEHSGLSLTARAEGTLSVTMDLKP